MNAKNPNAVDGVPAHIWTMAGGAKTVCTSWVLGWFGIAPGSYHYSGYKAQRAGVLRRNGWAVRSRNSAFSKGKTTGTLRGLVAAYSKDPAGTVYMVRLGYGGECHVILIDGDGKTLVDTDPRKRDRRGVLDVHAVFPMADRAQL